jgi:hypothetical protein
MTYQKYRSRNTFKVSGRTTNTSGPTSVSSAIIYRRKYWGQFPEINIPESRVWVRINNSRARETRKVGRREAALDRWAALVTLYNRTKLAPERPK